MSADLPGPADCAELLAFLPRLYEPDFQAVIGTHVGFDPEADRFRWAGPAYHPAVTEFFRTLDKPCWRDHSYDPERCGALLRDPDAIARADLATLRSLLTACNRAERFGDGAWGVAVDKGYVRALLTRLQQLTRAA